MHQPLNMSNPWSGYKEITCAIECPSAGKFGNLIFMQQHYSRPTHQLGSQLLIRCKLQLLWIVRHRTKSSPGRCIWCLPSWVWDMPTNYHIRHYCSWAPASPSCVTQSLTVCEVLMHGRRHRPPSPCANQDMICRTSWLFRGRAEIARHGPPGKISLSLGTGVENQKLLIEDNIEIDVINTTMSRYSWCELSLDAELHTTAP